ncbi:sigma-70 family RNA polymerase sigma factor [Streptococcus sp. zg-JUN1979]|uniref:sigma-70 family RNA polymerase sigma factor n=1 Tax=Streptococcus sp. zg-JUN1979 TaxID=3391450 RepID=UPI0039A47B47
MKSLIQFEILFVTVKPIIFKMKRNYYIKLWDGDDWLQEGRLVLYYLLKHHPELLDDESMFYRYFKTKFSSHLKDVIRKQESQKRRFDRMPYEDVNEYGHFIKDKGLLLDDFVAYKELLNKVEASLDAEGKVKLAKVISGERFKGKAKFIRELQLSFKEFKGYVCG